MSYNLKNVIIVIFNIINYFKEDGERIVVPVYNNNDDKFAYAKVFPQFPGVQFQVDLLTSKLTGINLNSTLILFTPFKLKNNKIINLNYEYPVLFTESLEGNTLQYHIRNKSISLIEKKLDPFYFTLKVIETLIMNYEDDKADNIIANEFINSKGEKSYRYLKLIIVFYNIM